MTKFEQRGVELQHEAVSIGHARKNFSYSCGVCCNRGLHLDCDRCAIAATHSLVVATLKSASVSIPRRVLR